MRLPDRVHFGGKPTRPGKLRAAKSPRSPHEGVKAGLKSTLNKLVFSLILSVARQSPKSHDFGLDEYEKQVFWLRGLPTCLTFPSNPDSGFLEAFVARYSGLYHTGFAPVFLFSRDFHRKHSSFIEHN